MNLPTRDKVLLLLIAAGCLGLLGLAADRPQIAAAPASVSARSPGSDVGRFQIIVTGEPHPLVIKLDTVTGQTWKFVSAGVENQHLKRKFTAEGWAPIAEDFAAELRTAAEVGKP